MQSNIRRWIKHTACEVARPVLSRAPRGHNKALSALGALTKDDPDWTAVTPRYRIVHDRQVDACFLCDMADWKDRWHYFSGRYVDRLNTLLIKALLRPGDVYIDVGANRGFFSVVAAQTVGPTGWVHAVEPNSSTRAHLKTNLTLNSVGNCTVHPYALSDCDGDALLSGATHDSGGWTLRKETSGCGGAASVATRRGDCLREDVRLSPYVLVKIDVEGYEHHVIKGMSALLSLANVDVIVEVTPAWLQEAGSSAAALIDDMRDLGFSAYDLNCRWSWRLRPSLQIRRSVRIANGGQSDILFSRRLSAARPVSTMALTEAVADSRPQSS